MVSVNRHPGAVLSMSQDQLIESWSISFLGKENVSFGDEEVGEDLGYIFIGSM